MSRDLQVKNIVDFVIKMSEEDNLSKIYNLAFNKLSLAKSFGKFWPILRVIYKTKKR